MARRENAAEIELYARHGTPPTLTDFDHASTQPGSTEEIAVASPAAGDWYFGIIGLDPYEDVELTVTW